MISFTDEIKEKHRENTLAVEDYVYNQIRKNSPVLSGAYRSNHNRSIGSPDFSFDPNKTSSSEPQPLGDDFDDYFIANGAPYAGELETGHSDQAPGGVYGVSYDSARAKFGL